MLKNNLLRKLKIKNRVIFVLVIGIFIFSFSILVFSKSFSQMVIKKYYYKNIKNFHQEIQNGIYLFLTNINMLSVRLLQNQSIYDLLSNDKISHDIKEMQLHKILKYINANKAYIGDIIIVTKKKEYYNLNNSINLEKHIDDKYLNTIKNKSNLISWGPIINENNQNYIMFGKRYYNFFTGQTLGQLIILINEKYIEDICNKSSKQSITTFIINNQNRIISHKEKKYINNIIFEDYFLGFKNDFTYMSKNFNNQLYLLAISKPSEQLLRLNSNWYIVSLIPISNLNNQLNKINLIISSFAAIIVLLSIIISLRISEDLIQPIKSLQDKINIVGKNTYVKPYIYKAFHDEVWELEKAFEDMTKRISNLLNTINEDMQKQRELELTALQAQINPHFLYNTLDTISWIAKIKKQNEIEKIIMALARFYRISLHKGEKYIRLFEEIELIKNFAIIEKTRFPDKFDIEYNITPETQECKILKFTIQPLVENSIKHGIMPKKSKGLIVINSFIIEDKLIIEVIDNGVGFDTSNLEKIKQTNRGGYGLKNVDERLKIEYGKEYGIFIQSQKNKGTKVTVIMKANV